MTDRLVLTLRLSERGVHDWAHRAVSSAAAGACVDSEPSDQEYGLREYGGRGPEKHRWWFSSPLAR